ncbi:metallophosphoesterase [Deinococcus sp.]|uniref:metallophosphoesterase n=1 Tax=Deinococcus sp. TaxID=47478 RepID=UPI0025ED0BB0|nr:metallophosphoesterase [Deinococcus sp.]
MSGPRPSIVVPDLHGCPHFLEWIGRAFPERSYIVLGDLIHRGPDSRTCLQGVLALAEAGRAVLLEGNHEFWVRDEGLSLEAKARELWFRQHEAKVAAQYRAAGENLNHFIGDMERFAALALPYHTEGQMLCAHAARPSFGTSPAPLDNGHLWDDPELGVHPLPTNLFPDLTYSVHGHSIHPFPLVDLAGTGTVYLDLGGYRTGQFCVWDAERRAVVFYPETPHQR